MMEYLDSMRLHVGATDESKDEILSLYIEDAKEFVLSFTHRETIPRILRGVVVRVAVVLFNRRGMEGNARFNVGDTAFVADVMPQDIIRQLNGYRSARIISMFSNGDGYEQND